MIYLEEWRSTELAFFELEQLEGRKHNFEPIKIERRVDLTMIIAILGPDGSGKTTIAEAICERLTLRGFVAKHYPMNFGVLPRLSRFRRRKVRVVDSADASQFDLKPSHPAKSLLLVGWYSVDYLLGGLFLRLKNWRRRDRTVAVFARYFHDYYYQSNNRNLPSWAKDICRLIVPKPDVVFFIDRDASDIHSGKPELPVEEIVRQQEVIVGKFGNEPNFVIVDGRYGLEATMLAVSNEIQKRIG